MASRKKEYVVLVWDGTSDNNDVYGPYTLLQAGRIEERLNALGEQQNRTGDGFYVHAMAVRLRRLNIDQFISSHDEECGKEDDE